MTIKDLIKMGLLLPLLPIMMPILVVMGAWDMLFGKPTSVNTGITNTMGVGNQSQNDHLMARANHGIETKDAPPWKTKQYDQWRTYH